MSELAATIFHPPDPIFRRWDWRRIDFDSRFSCNPKVNYFHKADEKHVCVNSLQINPLDVESDRHERSNSLATMFRPEAKGLSLVWFIGVNQPTESDIK